MKRERRDARYVYDEEVNAFSVGRILDERDFMAIDLRAFERIADDVPWVHWGQVWSPVAFYVVLFVTLSHRTLCSRS
jgi:hypothetical protein